MSGTDPSGDAALRRCPACGEENPARSRFCHACGSRLESAAPREERKLVSVLFVDLVGFTARADRADPEDVREILQLYHGEARRRIEQYGGVLEKFIGDAVMAVFGAPVAHGDDSERAVRAGLHVLAGIEELNRTHGLELSARAAVNTGDALVSLDGARAGDALATGDVVNVASRLQTAAPPGRLIVGAETHRATRQTIAYEELEPVDAKGKSEALPAWLALEPSTETTPPAAAGALVGRGPELELVHSLWSRCVTERRPHLITVLGPPGIGKSRLCRELSARVEAEDGRIVRGRCLPYEEQAGYQAFSRVVHEMSGIFESDPPEVARDKLRRAVEQLMPAAEAQDSARHLALLLGLASEDDVPRGELLFFAARRFLECAGLAQPTVVVFEDIHWAQQSEIDLLEYLARHLRESPVMLVAAARPELLDAHPTWGGGLAAQTTIPLDPLTAGDAAALVGRLLGADGDGRDRERIVDVAGGNPLFLEELAASVVELGGDEALPVTVREAIAARIDAMPSEVRTALLAAAVVGKTFWRGVLQALGQDEHEVDAALALLEARDLVRRDPSSQVAGDIQFTFKHMLIRDVAYATVPRATRRDLHAAVARQIEDRLGGATDTLSAILAYHWREAGEPRRAIPYLLSAADAARRSWAQGTVIELYSKAVDLADDDDVRRELRFRRALALVELADYEQASAELETLLPELHGQDRLDALIALGHATLWTERDVDTLATAHLAARLVEEVDDRTAYPAVLAMESQALAMRGAPGDLDRALELGDRALEHWVPETRPADLREHLHLHSDLTYWVGRYEQSIELSRRTRALASQEHSAESLLRGGGFEALAVAGLGRHEEAIAMWDELLALAGELGWSPRVLLNYSALAYRELHDLGEARRRTEQALELSASMSFGMPKQFAGSDLVFTQLLEGDIGAAQATWPAMWDGAKEATAWTTWLIAGRLACARAEIALHAETPEAALDWATRSVDLARSTRRRKYEARSLTLLGQALARLGRRDGALESVRAATAIADALVGPPARWQARAALGQVAYDLGDDDTAAAAYAEAAALITTFAGTLAPERAARLLAAPPIEDVLSLAGRRPVG